MTLLIFWYIPLDCLKGFKLSRNATIFFSCRDSCLSSEKFYSFHSVVCRVLWLVFHILKSHLHCWISLQRMEEGGGRNRAVKLQVSSWHGKCFSVYQLRANWTKGTGELNSRLNSWPDELAGQVKMRVRLSQSNGKLTWTDKHLSSSSDY